MLQVVVRLERTGVNVSYPAALKKIGFSFNYFDAKVEYTLHSIL
jgi:hypothetical protein